MRRKIFIFTISILVLVSCSNKNTKLVTYGKEKEEIISGDTSEVKENKEVADFKSVNITSVSTVDIKIGPACSVSVDGQKAYVDAQHIFTDNGVLTVLFNSDNPVKRNTHLNITAPTLDAINLSRCGILTVHGNDINVKTFSLYLDKINIAKINSKIISDRTIIKTHNTMYSSIMTDCNDLLLSTSHIIHIQILGKVKHYKCFGGGKSKIDMKKT